MRIPVEGLVGIVVLLLLPNRWRRPVAIVAGAALGVLTILKLTNMGFYASLNRPFDPVYDWSFLGPGLEFVQGQVGEFGGWAAAALVIVVAIGLIVFTALSVSRLGGFVANHRTGTVRGVAVLAVVWLVLAPTGAQLAPASPWPPATRPRSPSTTCDRSARTSRTSGSSRTRCPRTRTSAPRTTSCSAACAARTCCWCSWRATAGRR
ncbi:hypothetical protein [Kutzneria kofuensis]|uniref:hypothetical protein n=1 Tax=Kutzneria kofuensis TaxID=103725 RepID=UPI0031F0C01F